MRTQTRFRAFLSAILLVPAICAFSGCMNPYPSIMKPPADQSNSPQPPSPQAPAPPAGGGIPPSGDSDGGSDSSSSGGDSGSPLPMPGGMPMPGGGSPGDAGEQQGGMPGEQGEDSGGDGDGGWETSNQLPDPLNIPGGIPDIGMPGEEGDEDEDGDEDGEADGDAMGSVLGDLDGDIMDRRNEARDRGNADGGEKDLPGANEDGLEPGGVKGAKEGAALPEKPDQPAVPGPTPAPKTGGLTKPGDKGRPDAKDDDIIARQLKEAAEAETNPELKIKLWEEYNKYKSRR